MKKPRPPMRSASFHLEPLQLARLRRLHAVTKVPQAALVREGVDAMLEAREAQLAGQGVELPALELPAAPDADAPEGATAAEAS